MDTKDLLIWLSQETQWGDIHRKPYYEAIAARLSAFDAMEEALKDLLTAEVYADGEGLVKLSTNDCDFAAPYVEKARAALAWRSDKKE